MFTLMLAEPSSIMNVPLSALVRTVPRNSKGSSFLKTPSCRRSASETERIGAYSAVVSGADAAVKTVEKMSVETLITFFILP